MGKKWKNGNLNLSFFIIFDPFLSKNSLIHTTSGFSQIQRMKPKSEGKLFLEKIYTPGSMLKLALHKGMKFILKKIKTPSRFNDKPLGYALETIIESLGGFKFH